MAATWREDRPLAITAASHKAERPSRSRVMMFSALSSSSEAMMRLSNSLCWAGLALGLGAAIFFLTARFLAGLAAGFLAVGFLAVGFLAADFFAAEGAGFFAADVLVADFLAAGFFAAPFLGDGVLRVRVCPPLRKG